MDALKLVDNNTVTSQKYGFPQLSALCI